MSHDVGARRVGADVDDDPGDPPVVEHISMNELVERVVASQLEPFAREILRQKHEAAGRYEALERMLLNEVGRLTRRNARLEALYAEAQTRDLSPEFFAEAQG